MSSCHIGSRMQWACIGKSAAFKIGPVAQRYSTSGTGYIVQDVHQAKIALPILKHFHVKKGSCVILAPKIPHSLFLECSLDPSKYSDLTHFANDKIIILSQDGLCPVSQYISPSLISKKPLLKVGEIDSFNVHWTSEETVTVNTAVNNFFIKEGVAASLLISKDRSILGYLRKDLTPRDVPLNIQLKCADLSSTELLKLNNATSITPIIEIASPAGSIYNALNSNLMSKYIVKDLSGMPVFLCIAPQELLKLDVFWARLLKHNNDLKFILNGLNDEATRSKALSVLALTLLQNV